MRSIPGKIIDDVRWLVGLWDQFWFTPSSPAALGWLRILAGLMLVYTHAVWSLRLEEFFGPRGFQDPVLVKAYLADSTAWTFWLVVPDSWLWPVHWTCLAILGLFTIGFWTRLTSILSVIITISYLNRAPLANFGLDQINTLLVVYLALGPCGATLSFDRWWARYRTARAALRSGKQPVAPAIPATVTANISLRLIEVHMAVLYFWAGLSKLKGYSWWDGTAIWLGAANYEYQSLSLTWLAWYPWVYNFISHFTVLWELTFFLTVCHPRLRPYTLLIGASMHLGIGAFMGMWTFGLVMIFTYVSYMPAAMAEAAQRWLAGSLVGAARVVRYIPTRFASRGRAVMLATLDPDSRLRFAAEDEAGAPLAPPESTEEAAAPTLIESVDRGAQVSDHVPLQPVPLQPAPTAAITPAAISPVAWWKQLRTNVVADWSQVGAPEPAGTGAVLIVGGTVRSQVAMDELLAGRGYRTKAVPDAASAALHLALRPCDALILMLDHAEERSDLEFLRDLCQSGRDSAPVTLVVLSKRLFDKFNGRPRADHRVVTAPFSATDLAGELALAYDARGWKAPREAVLAEQQG
jgi:hypothetical protein